MNRSSRLAAIFLIAAIVTPSVPGRADERRIRCESNNYRYRFCAADTDNRVRLDREISRRNCVLWNTWGYDKRGVWVDRGCRAEFTVGHEGLSGGETAAIGAVAAAAIIAAILAHKGGEKHNEDVVPSWAVGYFTGWDDRD